MGDIPKCIRRIFMRNKKIIIAVLVTTILMTVQMAPVSAAESLSNVLLQTNSVQVITPLWNSTNIVTPSISNSGKRISVSVYILPKKQTTTSKGTLYLEKKSGRSWKPVASWPINATGTVSLTKPYTGTSGATYRTRVVVTTGADKIDRTSAERTV